MASPSLAAHLLWCMFNSNSSLRVVGPQLTVVRNESRLEPYPPLTEDQVRASMASTAAPTPFSQRQLSATPLPASARPGSRQPSAASKPPVPLFRPSPTATPEPHEADGPRDDGELERFRLRSQSLALDLDDDEEEGTEGRLPPQIHSKGKRSISRVVEEENE